MRRQMCDHDIPIARIAESVISTIHVTAVVDADSSRSMRYKPQIIAPRMTPATVKPKAPSERQVAVQYTAQPATNMPSSSKCSGPNWASGPNAVLIQ